MQVNLGWCQSKDIWLSIAHIPGKHNTCADLESRKTINTSTEWKLRSDELQDCYNRLSFYPDTDLFASRINYQVDRFVSFKPDPDAFAIDTFTLDWGTLKFYAFPPFSLISKVINKIHLDQAEGICVLPDWPTQPWYSKVKALMKTAPIVIKPNKNLLWLPLH